MDAIITIDEQQRIVLFNRAAEAMFRCSADTALGTQLERLIPERYRKVHAHHVRDFGATGVTSRSMWRPGVLLALRADGEEFPIEATISQIETVGEKLFTVILRDVTERVRVEEAMRAARDAAETANRAKDQFIAIMSHELRTPLNAIVGYSDLLLARVWGDMSEEQERALDRVRNSSKHLIAIIEQVLLYSRSEQGRQVPRYEATSVAQTLRGVADLVEPAISGKGLALHVDLPHDDVEIETDPGMLRQIVLNLLSNAINFTDAGSISLAAELTADNLLIDVVDTGIGISQEDQDRIFDAFWQVDQTLTRRTGGTGLGLSIVRRLTDALNGTIDLDSEVGRGTRFTVRLPARRLSSTPSPE